MVPEMLAEMSKMPPAKPVLAGTCRGLEGSKERPNVCKSVNIRRGFVRFFRILTRSDGLFLLLRHFGPPNAGNGLIFNGC